MENQMFCYQCQETAGCSGCTRVGVCGKQPDIAAMQDLLVYVTKGISAVTTTLRQEGVEIQPAVNHMITLNLFTTITNANFSKEAIIARIQETLSEKDLLLSKLTPLIAQILCQKQLSGTVPRMNLTPKLQLSVFFPQKMKISEAFVN